MFLNHCLDLLDAIEEQRNTVDYQDLSKTDFPRDVPIPAAPHLSEDEVEDIKQWVLSVSMDQHMEMVNKISIILFLKFSMFYVLNIIMI